MTVNFGIVCSAARASWLAFLSGMIAGAGAGTGSGRGWQSPTPPMQQHTSSWHLAPQFTLQPENGQTSGLSHWQVGQPPEVVKFEWAAVATMMVAMVMRNISP